MRPDQFIKTAHPIIYPSFRRNMVDSFIDRGIDWILIDYIPWNQNQLVLWELEAIKNGSIKYGKRRAHEWRHNKKIYYRDVFNHIWQKENGKMNWIGIYDHINNIIDVTANEPKQVDKHSCHHKK